MKIIRRYKWWLSALLVLLAAYGGGRLYLGGGRLYYKMTDGFSLENISSSFGFDDRWVTHPLSAEEKELVDTVLSQEFHYLGKGCQSYVFESADGKYVIKFFKYQRYRQAEWVKQFDFIPSVHKHRMSRTAHKQRKLEGVFKSWVVAFNHAKEETGLIYVHLNKTEGLGKRVTLIDKMNRRHAVDIDQYEFLIQKKGIMLTAHLDFLMREGRVEEAKQFLDALVMQILGEYRRGVADNDPALMQNTGVIDGAPAHLDVGQFDFAPKYAEKSIYEPEIFQKFYKFRRWLTKEHPALGKHLDAVLLREFGGEFFRIPPNPRYVS
ncbi:hypothetical protein [Estrella lausannensis]|uniref:Uncharacterized protein n=1 Tax=Estrella lausannensis TaxID=483423 RepID=A0A0H5E4J0_9BACT|nr:hypothetical protein [Estrella lausannensis]CRX38130.1 hypothetical protein ELAC_0778 [Estrella lausannensis]